MKPMVLFRVSINFVTSACDYSVILSVPSEGGLYCWHNSDLKSLIGIS